MIKRIIILNSFFISFYSQAQFKDSADLIRQEIKKFFTTIHPFGEGFYISDKPKKPVLKETITLYFPNDTLFSKADLEFVDKQAIMNNIVVWDTLLIDKRILIKDSDAKSKQWYMSYSPPAFSLDFQTCILLVDENCNLGLCGHGSIVILRKINNRWEIVEGEMTWVS